MKRVDDDIARRALRRLLLPVMKFCLRHSFKFQEISEACKMTLLEAAQLELARTGERETTNRVSLMTGLHRADVTRLRVEPESAEAKASSGLMSRIISRWQVDRRFRTKQGKPRVLTFDGKTGEFAKLLHSVSSDPNPYSVLHELERMGAVEVTPRGIRLRTAEYIIHGDAPKIFSHLAQDCDDLITAVEQNIYEASEEPNLHLRTEYDNIGEASLPAIRRWFLKEGSVFHRRIRDLLARYDRDTNPKVRDKSPRMRVSLCTFSRTALRVESNSENVSERSGE